MVCTGTFSTSGPRKQEGLEGRLWAERSLPFRWTTVDYGFISSKGVQVCIRQIAVGLEYPQGTSTPKHLFSSGQALALGHGSDKGWGPVSTAAMCLSEAVDSFLCPGEISLEPKDLRISEVTAHLYHYKIPVR